MRNVSIVGVGQTKAGEHWERSLRDLAADAIAAAMQEAQVEAVEALYVGNMLSREVGQEHVGALVADWAGLGPIEAIKVEAADASGAAAVRMGYLAVASGACDLVLVCGAEKTTDVPPEAMEAAWSTALDAEYESLYGISPVSMCALLMRRYMQEFGYKHDDFAPFAITAHANGANNPNAMFQRAINPASYMRSAAVVDPITMFDGAPLCDGAAAVVLAPSDYASNFPTKPVRIRASAVATDRLAVGDRSDPLSLQAASLSAQRAYGQAGVGPSDIGLFELHDAFTILAALELEACGFAGRGEGVRIAGQGDIALTGRIPISTLGGLKARGHAIGATGVYQIIEVVKQLRGEAGGSQVAAKLGMAQSLGGTGATAITHILEAH